MKDRYFFKEFFLEHLSKYLEYTKTMDEAEANFCCHWKESSSNSTKFVIYSKKTHEAYIT